MKVLLTTLNSKYVHTNLALRYLYKCIEKEHDTEIKEYTINMQIDDIVSDITNNNYDVICFSTYIWNIENTLKIANVLKTINNKIKIILGGPEVTYNSYNLLKENEYIDYIMRGEGEEVITKLLNNISSKKTIEGKVEGIAYRKDGQVIEGEIAKVYDTTKIPRVAKMLADEYNNKLVYFESSRGCPYRCAYCLSSVEKTVRPFDITRVKEELKILLDKNVRTIKFVDRTFNYSKERALDIWKFIIDNRKDTTCHFEIAAHILDDETIEFLNNAPKGAFQFEVGVQSTNENTIKAINRNVKFERIYNVISKLKNNNIHMHLDLIAGLPYENYESFKKSFNDVFKLNPSNLQLGFLKLLKGCPINDVTKLHEYKYSMYPPYEVLSNKYISYDELKKLKKVEKVLDIYNNQEVYKNTIKYIMTENLFESPFDFFEKISEYYDENKLFDKKIGQEETFDIIYYFLEKEEKLTDNLKEILKLDYNLKYNSKRFFTENKEENLKKYIDEIIKDEEYIQSNLKKYTNLNRQEKIKRLKFIVFDYDVIDNYKLKEKNIYIFDRESKEYITKYKLKRDKNEICR